MILKTALVALMIAAAPIGEVDLITVTDHGFALTFFTEDVVTAEVRYGPDAKDLDEAAVEEGDPTRFHYFEITGLDPGEDYYYRIEADGAYWPAKPLPPRKVATLSPPEGDFLFSFAVINDLHVGEDVAGLMVAPLSWLPPLTPGFTWKNPVDNYWSFTLRAAVDGINRRGAELTVANGDLTSWYTEEEFALAKSHLDRLDAPYYVTRGNHDRVGDYSEDYFRKVFGLETSWHGADHKGFHFIMLDDNRPENGWHGFTDEEFDWFEDDLAANAGKPTFVFCHRPIGAGAVDIDKNVRARFLAIVADNPQVVGVFNGHSHKARLTTLKLGGRTVPFIEVPAVKEYPVGYGMVKVYESGFMYNYHPSDCADCREWRHITRGEYFGLAPQVLLGDLDDRASVHMFMEEY